MIKELIKQCQEEIDKNGCCSCDYDEYDCDNPCDCCQYNKSKNKNNGFELFVCQKVKELYLKYYLN